MNIVIQGPQGQGKTRTAEAIVQTYPEEAVLRVWGYKKNDQYTVQKHCRDCANFGLVPLVVFEELDREQMQKALTLSKRLSSAKGAGQIDKIFITNERLNIS